MTILFERLNSKVSNLPSFQIQNSLSYVARPHVLVQDLTHFLFTGTELMVGELFIEKSY